MSPFLLLPPEIRLQIYSPLLLLPPIHPPSLPPSVIPASRLVCFEFLLRSLPHPTSSYPPLPEPRRSASPGSRHGGKRKVEEDKEERLYVGILGVCRKVYHEAVAVLYGGNVFFADEVLLTGMPRIRPWFGPVLVGEVGGRVRRWHLRLRLDAPPAWPRDKVTQAFAGAEELVVQVWQATFLGGVGADVLRRFEGVRGVRRTEIRDAPPGFEGYTAWLEKRMRLPAGDEGEKYVCEDEAEEKRLMGWGAQMFSEI